MRHLEEHAGAVTRAVRELFGVDREGLATLVLSVMEGAVMQARVARSLEPFDTSVAMLRACFEKLFDTGGDTSNAKS